MDGVLNEMVRGESRQCSEDKLQKRRLKVKSQTDSYTDRESNLRYIVYTGVSRLNNVLYYP